MDDIVIKEISSDYEDRLIALYRTYREWHPPAKFGEGLRRYPAFAAFQGDKVVAFVTLAYFAPDVIELYNIYVDAPYRNQGLGAMLLRRVEEGLKDTPYQNVILINSDGYQTYDVKHDPRNFYERNGYQLLKQTEATRIFYKELNI